MNRIIAFIGKVFSVPPVLLKNCGKVYLSGIFILLFTIIGTVTFKMTASFLLCGLGLAIAVFIMASHMLYMFTSNRYTVYDGLVIDSYPTGVLKWRALEVLFATVENDTYSFQVKEKRFRLLPGDKVTIYCPTNAFIDDKNGVNVIANYFAFTRHK